MDQERSTLISHKKAANTDLAININNSIINRINMEIWVDRIRTNMDNIRLKELGCKELQEVPNISNKITIKAVSFNKINILKANSLTVIWRRVFMVAKINNN
jgi:SHS2 domain-containing protein